MLLFGLAVLAILAAKTAETGEMAKATATGGRFAGSSGRYGRVSCTFEARVAGAGQRATQQVRSSGRRFNLAVAGLCFPPRVGGSFEANVCIIINSSGGSVLGRPS